jgi:molecular chaperone DnaK (HSP70)
MCCSLSIKAFVDHLMNALEKRETGLRDDEIKWVFTVPAAWTDSGKQLMRESAEKVLLSNTYLHHSATKFQTH